MQVAESRHAGSARDATLAAAMPATPNQDLEVVLTPLSRPDLAEIRISDGVFAIGRNEQPFASCDPEIQVMLSRRHARIFIEGGAAYLADLESRNGTTVNRTSVQHKPVRLADGDEICFGGVLSFRVQVSSRAAAARPQGLTLTLTPAAADAGLQPLVIARFPFLISKADAAFARYRASHPSQLDYLSRRQAHIFLKGGSAHIEDLASANGTFLDGERLQEHAVPLRDGMRLAFAGDHFVYRVTIDQGAAAPESVQTHAATPAAAPNVNAGKTTFVAAPDSFLEIFCADAETPETAPSESAAPPQPAAAAAVEPQPAQKARSRGRVAAMFAELAAVAASGERGRARRTLWTIAALIAGLIVAAVGLSWWVRSERELKDLIERGEYAQAALKADQALQRNPDDGELKTLATEAALKAKVPVWLGRVAARDFDGARGVLADLGGLARSNPELAPLVGELEWLGQLEQLVSSRGPDAPIRIYADEDRIAAVIERWNRDTREHQRSLARIASFVPEFNAPYAAALTHLRKLQSDATVYLAAIERLKTSLAAEVARDRADELQPVLKEAAEKYPGLGGLDGVRQDLARYVEIRREAHARQPARLLALMRKARIVTPPFRDSMQAMTASGQLPPADVMRSYDATVKAWQDGQTAQALAGLQAMVTGPWAEAAAAELKRKQAVLAQHASLQQARAGNAYADALIAFRESLDVDEDGFFLRATQAELEQNRGLVAARADGLMSRARALWQEYRGNGAITAAQRIETTISNGFRTQARLLSDARQNAQRAAQVHALLGAAAAANPSAAVRDEIQAEAQAQRSALQDLRNVLDPQLVKEKLALLGERPE